MVDQFFNGVYGKGLAKELNDVAHRPYLVVTMEDLWPLVRDDLSEHLEEVFFVRTLEYEELVKESEKLEGAKSVIGVGGGRALDVAKFFAWQKHLPLFQMPTSTSVNAAFTHRIGLRFDGMVKYRGWAVPEVVYIDYDLVGNAPEWMNRQGVGEVFCIHTAHYDWKLATENEQEKKWPWDEDLAKQANDILNRVFDGTGEIKEQSNEGIRSLMEAHRQVGAFYHNSGWNPRPIEGSEHAFYYNLEKVTGRDFQHGEIVSLGIILMSYLQENKPDMIEKKIREAGVRTNLSELGVEWKEVEETLLTLNDFAQQVVREQIPPYYTVLNAKEIPRSFLTRMKEKFES